MRSTIDRQCGKNPELPEANEKEKAALDLGAATAGKIDLRNSTDAQIQDLGQSTCENLKDRHQVNLCVQEFKSRALTGFSCSSHRPWYQLFRSATEKICDAGGKAANGVDLSKAMSVSEAKKSIQKKIDRECSSYKNQIASRLCKEGGRNSESANFTGCSGLPSVITSDDFDGRWNGSETVNADNPCSSGEYGVNSFNYKVEIDGSGATVKVGRVKLTEGIYIYPDTFGVKMGKRREPENPCHELELQADQIVCRLGARTRVFKIPRTPEEIQKYKTPPKQSK